ncbi:MAG: DUF2258 domain-containing protein [Desulfurococcaceae archaeon]
MKQVFVERWSNVLIGESTPPTESRVEQELNTGIIIAGAYADKVRRTLFAQLSSYVRTSKDYATEVARGAAELNTILYHIIVENLKSDKGDAVRIRIRYTYDAERNVLEWDYNSLKIEFYKRVPDEQVDSIAKRVVNEKLFEVKSRFGKPGALAEITRSETASVQTFEPVEQVKLIGKIENYGETPSGGLVFVARDVAGGILGMGSVDYEAGDLFVDVVILHGENGYRARFRASRRLEDYKSNPELLLNEIRNQKFIVLNTDDAKELIKEKMRSIK